MRFKRVYIEITNMCNLNCSFCSPVKREKRQMRLEEFEKIIEQIKPYTDYVYFHIKGEPLTHPFVMQFFDICSKNSIRVNLTTNATLMYKYSEELLSKESLRQVNFSLHSISEQKNPDKDRYFNTAFNFAKRASESMSALSVFRIWNLHNNQENEESMYIFNRIKDFFNFDEEFTNLLKMPRIKVNEGIFLSLDDEFHWPNINDPVLSDDGICYGTRAMIGILCDGTVVPCCLDSDGMCEFGNIYEKNLVEILKSDKFNAVFNNFQKRKVVAPLCRRCTYRQRFDK